MRDLIDMKGQLWGAADVVVMIAGLFGFAYMRVAVFADTGVSVLCLLNSIRILYRK